MGVQSWQQYRGESFTYTIDWSVSASRLGTSVSSVVWSVDEGSATITNEALGSNVASALVTTSSVGCVLIKVTATLGDGQIDIHYFKIKVSEPSCGVSTNRY